MIRVSHTIKGMQKLMKQFDTLDKEMKTAPIAAVQEATFLIHETAVRSIQDNGSGIPQARYSRSGTKRIVLASHPGDPPNTDTGRLVQSIKFDFLNGGLIGRVGTNLKYGAWLEFGTKIMAARPWLSAAVRETSKEIGRIFKRAVHEAIQEATR